MGVEVSVGSRSQTLCCVTCGYQLRGAPLDGVCPECGAPVSRTLAAAQRRNKGVVLRRTWQWCIVAMIVNGVAVTTAIVLVLIGPTRWVRSTVGNVLLAQCIAVVVHAGLTIAVGMLWRMSLAAVLARIGSFVLAGSAYTVALLVAYGAVTGQI